MPDYRWGSSSRDPEPIAKIGFGDIMGEPAWEEVPGEFRNALRRIIVTQADTEPAWSSSSAYSATPAHRSTTCATSSR